MQAPLTQYESDTFSQFGEDGIIAECLSRISAAVPLDKWCVEFGAWDGVYLSNTCRLIREEGYSAVMVEGNLERFRELEKNHPDSRVHKIQRWISLSGEGRLEKVLSTTPLPRDFDLLSIDIDSCDWHVWNSIESYRPKIVVIEFNPTIPNCVSYVQPPDFSVRQGNSARAIDDLAHEKGYVLVAATTVNLIYVERALADPVLGVSRPELGDLRDEAEHVAYVFAGYNGEVFCTNPVQLMWHGIKIGPRRLQMLPRVLQRFRDEYSWWQTVLHKILREYFRLRYGKGG
jgi:hypothetical protein